MKLFISYNLNELIRDIHEWERKNRERSALVKCEKVWHDLYMTDLFFPKQKNVAAHTEFTWKPIEELIEYLWTDKLEDFWKYCIWLHSHHTMNAFWSWEDRSTRKWFKDWWCNHFVSVVTSIKNWSNNCNWVYYHATLDIFKPIDFEIDLEVQLWLPWITTITEEETNKYKAHLESIQQIKDSANYLNEQYWIPKEQVLDSIKEFTWSQFDIFYEEWEYTLDNEEKIKQLKDVEETFTLSWFDYSKRGKDFNNNKKKDKVYLNNKDMDLLQPHITDKWYLIFKINMKWGYVLDKWYPQYLSRWWYASLEDLTYYHKLKKWFDRDFKFTWDMWERNIKWELSRNKSVMNYDDDDEEDLTPTMRY